MLDSFSPLFPSDLAKFTYVRLIYFSIDCSLVSYQIIIGNYQHWNIINNYLRSPTSAFSKGVKTFHDWKKIHVKIASGNLKESVFFIKDQVLQVCCVNGQVIKCNNDFFKIIYGRIIPKIKVSFKLSAVLPNPGWAIVSIVTYCRTANNYIINFT